MHSNRLIYTLPEYQAKLRRNYKKLGLFLEEYETHKIFIFRPVPKTPWLPEGRKKYFGKLFSRFENLPFCKKYSFATLTYSATNYTPVSCARRIKHDIDLFFKRLGYHHREFEYFYVIELTDKFMPHIHIIFNSFIPKSKIKASWFAVSGNFITHIKHLPQKQAFYYCVKYLADSKKQGEDKWSFLFSHIDRLWSCSRGFFAVSVSNKGKYKFLFCLWDPNLITSSDFSNPLKDLKSNEVNIHDAICIAGFTDRFSGCRVLHSDPDWLFYTSVSVIDFDNTSVAVTPECFQLMFDFYKSQ